MHDADEVRHPTARQIGRLYNLARLCALDHDATKALLQEQYQVASSKDLTMYQYEAFTAELQRHADTIARGRQLPPAAAHPRDGMYASAEHLREFAQGVKDFRRAWADDLTDDDVTVLAVILDKFRLYRSRDRKLSQAQLDEFLTSAGKFQLWVFRRACEIYLSSYTTKPERYFLGIMKNVVRDRNRELAAAQRDLLLV
jgi:hypothetical protein